MFQTTNQNYKSILNGIYKATYNRRAPPCIMKLLLEPSIIELESRRIG